MNRQKRFYRRLACIGIVIALLLLLNWMGHPSRLQGKLGSSDTEKTFAPGGKLARLRDQYGLSETKLGEIDPAGSAMKLATFGMRGVAVALLWNRSLECEKRADWESVRTIGEQITSLEPHFITIWDFVGWKLAYNASAQYDDYRERYRWVTNGFDFLQNGTVYNRLSAKLHKATGWTISQKIGVADEKNQYRRLFREDHDFHQRQKDLFWDPFWSRYQQEFTYDERPDNWLFGRVFYLAAERLFEDPANKGSDLGKETRPVFFCRSRMNLLNYAKWMEIDGCGVTYDSTPVFDERAANAWSVAEKAWNEFSEKRITSVIEDRKKPGEYRVTYLNEFKDCLKERDEVYRRLEGMLPDGVTVESIVWDRFNNELDDDLRGALYEAILNPSPATDDLREGGAERAIRIVRDYLDGKYGPQPSWENWRERLADSARNLFPEEDRPIFDRPGILRSQDEATRGAAVENKKDILRSRARDLLSIDGKKIAERIEGDARLEAEDLCDRLEDIRYRGTFSGMYREMLDCVKHEHDVVVEQQPETRRARELRVLARDRFYAGQQEEASEAYLGSMAKWRELMERPEFGDVRGMSQYRSAFIDEIDKYTIILDQLERIFPADYPFEPIAADDDADSIDSVEKALAFIQGEIDAQKTEQAGEDLMRLLGFWQFYFRHNEYNPLFPTNFSRESFAKTMRLFVENRAASPERLAAARQEGLIEENRLKPQLELLVRKGEPAYAEIVRNDAELNTGAENETELLLRNRDLWLSLFEKYPFLIYDRESEFRPQVERLAARLADLPKEEGGEAPAFPPEGWE